MQVKLKRDNYYLSETEGQKFGKKGEIINIDPLFYKHVKGNSEEKEPDEKPLDKMNKAELVEKAKEVGLEYTDDEYEAFNKADIIRLIQEKK